MNKKIVIVLLLMLGVLMPFNVMAKESEYLGKTYNTLNFKEALAEEEIEEEFSDYSESDDKITIYLFRGKGCTYCRAYLSFMNSITEEYGKYFNMVSFEVWNDSTNSGLMSEVAEFMDEEADGVPFIIIGDKTFSGYAESYDEEIKTAITDLYNTDKDERYDVFKKMNDNPKSGDDSEGNTSSTNIIIWNLVFTSVSTLIIVLFVNSKMNKINEKIDAMNKKNK